MLEGSRDSASLLQKKKTKMANKLELLKQQVHVRKIQQIEDTGKKYHDENSQFGKRQENILLNALQFINDVSNGKAEDDTVAPEERGVDKGFECKLVAEQRDDPEFRRLIEEDDFKPASTTVEKYGQKAQILQRELEHLGQEEVNRRIALLEQTQTSWAIQ